MTDVTPGAIDRLLRLLFEQTKEHAILLIDTEGVITWWNSGAERIFGISRTEAIGQHSSIIFTPDERARRIPELEIATAEADGGAMDDRWLARLDGSRFWANGILMPLKDERGNLIGFGKILRNRTDLKEQLETLRNQAEASAVSDHRKDVFLSTLAHELRNPLAALTNAVEIIRISTDDLEMPLSIIERQISNMQRLVDDLLDLARIGAGKIELKKEGVVLQEIIERAVESALPALKRRRHHLEVVMPPSPLQLRADAARLQQVFVNLIDNAIKYTPEGGRIWVKGTTGSREAVVHVEDTGVGIPGDVLPRIFKLFTQAESTRSHSQGGLGIGLSLVKELVALHGGSVQVRSDGAGKGSEFTVRLPLEVDASRGP